ncbi:hypothetical protein [Sphingobium agri]|uniref:Uncharacterized protein n=1 Tax=Sphingobium agri TaxID=2933566 RepID=A0ABT0DUB9_9SPHN|nr:hypothetical protein [Sphingobium agri]MCK0530702.1 hypothetical protein [Sphingobium agri]
MPFRLTLVILAGIGSGIATAKPISEQQAQALVEAGKDHLEINNLKKSTASPIGPTRAGMTKVIYETPTGGRFATYYLGAGGVLKEFVMNSPDLYPYTPVRDRRALITRLMQIAAPHGSQAERNWAANQLNAYWTQSVRPLPVRVGDYVFRGGTTRTGNGFHDTFWVVAADRGYTGLKYHPKH